MPYRLKKLLQQYAVTKQRFLIFVPEIADIPYVLNWVVRYVAAEAVFAADEQRVSKVQAMREHQIQGLVTTTILERGVTFPNLDVVILGADEASYSEAALIQMAGRCGRSKDFPTGLVLCVVTEKTHKVHRAAKEIRRLNRMR
ncbi:helicase-related protein [Weissella soli]|uniref:helicase-related protein n=1 Tax=Weissella soli TaxID=155866 RepID=UPI0021C21B3B|nr:helicase-related protein [Weissella soli]